MQKLTETEVLAAWAAEHEPNTPCTPLDLKRMRSTLLKRAERLRKKNAAGLTAAVAPRASFNEQAAALVVSIAPLPEAQVTNVKVPLPVSNFEIHPGADFEDHSAPADPIAELAAIVTPAPVENVVLGTSAGFPEAEAPAYRRRYTCVPVLSGGYSLPVVQVDAFSEKEAYDLVHAGLSDAQKDTCNYIDIANVQDIPAPTSLLVMAGNSRTAAVLAALHRGEDMVLVTDNTAGPAPTPTPKSDVETITEETDVKKNKTTKKAGKRTPREDVVKSATFIALFDKAIAKSRDPKRTHCKNGHTITAAHAHVGDLKRTGRYTCDPCNTDAQAKYNAEKK